MRWRLGLDLGSGSIGWCAFLLDQQDRPMSILGAGVHIFGDGRAPARGDVRGLPLAAERRAARAMRRRRDRFKRRQGALLRHLVADGLLPADDESRQSLKALDPYELRTRALDTPLTLHQLGRALLHLNRRRGFKSNRKTERDGKEAGKIAVGIDRLTTAMKEAGARTLGEFLHMRRCSASGANAIPSVRARLRPETDSKGDGYDFYPGRALIEAEFDAIWEAQHLHHPMQLTSDVHARLYEIIFHQRPLKAPVVGRCTLLPEETRLPKAHPLFQRRRLLEELNALMILEPGQPAEPLTLEQRNVLLLRLSDRKSVSFDSLRKLLKLPAHTRFNKETEGRDSLTGDEVAAELGGRTRFGKRWFSLTSEEQWAIVSHLIEEEDAVQLHDWLRERWGVTRDQADAIARARLPEGYGRFGLTATLALIDALKGSVVVYSDAVKTAGLGHHSDFRTADAYDFLPYYGRVLERHILPGTADPGDPEEMRIGRLTNPTVHIGLNQLRQLVNLLVRRFGRPHQIAMEIARELKQSDEDRKRASRTAAENRRHALIRSEKLLEVQISDTGANRARLKLWEELNPDNVLDRRCVYTGIQISMAMLFSDIVEIDHILPFDATLDDSLGNRILCMREANRFKRKRTPFEAWGHTAEWDAIAERAARLPVSKRWRFAPDAMDRYRSEGGFAARHLVDTQYLSRIAREYLSALYPETGKGSNHVWVSPGRLTEMVRRKLGLNDLLPDHNYAGPVTQAKNRLDHRHHAIDAAVVGIVDRAQLQAISRASGLTGADGREEIVIPEPFPGFRNALGQAVNAIVVSHRPDHGVTSKVGLARGRDQTVARLHNDQAYGLTGQQDANGNDLVVHRALLTSLNSKQFDEGSTGAIVRDARLRDALRKFTAGYEGKAFEARLTAFPKLGPLEYRGIRRVRLIEPLRVIPIRDAKGRAYKGYKGNSNYRFDVWELPDSSWRAEVVSMFDAHQPGWTSTVRASCPTARKVLSLQRDDLIAIEPAGAPRQLMRVVKFGLNGQVTLAAPQESGDLKARDKLPNDQDPFKYISPTASGLKQARARQVRIDKIGRVFDPGFPARKTTRKTRRAVTDI
ncbi:type II CRISPR RNA-guided endonuclease Cas9 [Tistrella mobilis]|uniref:type II CRISPR RNA-guided endonuclease Cas9 n=1 Tax=Tistrella mobilis TaxID=171437 RepID=UPI003557210B